MYTSRQYLRVFVLSVLAALGVFYISTFIDLADKLFRGSATTWLLLRFFYYQTPQYLYYIIPIAVPRRDARHDRRDDEEQRAGRHEGVRHEPVSRGDAAAALRASPPAPRCSACRKWCWRAANQEADRLNGIIRGSPPRPSAS